MNVPNDASMHNKLRSFGGDKVTFEPTNIDGVSRMTVDGKFSYRTQDINNLKLNGSAHNKLNKLSVEYDNIINSPDNGIYKSDFSGLSAKNKKSMIDLNKKTADVLHESGYPAIDYINLYETPNTMRALPSTVITSKDAIRLPSNALYDWRSMTIMPSAVGVINNRNQKQMTTDTYE
jgi:hypothetical protein